MIVSPRKVKFVFSTLFVGLLMVPAQAQSDQTSSVTGDGPAAAQGAQTSTAPLIATEEPVMVRAEAGVIRLVRRGHPFPEKVERKQSESQPVVAAEAAIPVRPQIEQRTSNNLVNRLLLKKAMKKSAAGKWYGGKEAARQQASKEASTLTILGAVLSGLGIILLFVIPIIGVLFVLAGNIMLFIEALK